MGIEELGKIRRQLEKLEIIPSQTGKFMKILKNLENKLERIGAQSSCANSKSPEGEVLCRYNRTRCSYLCRCYKPKYSI